MSTLYELRAFDTSGAKQHIVTDFASLAYKKVVNEPGILQVGIRGTHPLAQALADKWQLEVWRKPAGQAWVRDFTGIYRQAEWAISDRWDLTLLCPGLLAMLGWRIINWPAETANRTRFASVVGETVMKTMVSYNAGAQATTGNGRKRNGGLTGLTVEADSARGSSVTWYCAQDRLLESLQKLAPLAGGDFDLVKTSNTAWQFRWGVWSYVNGSLAAASDRSASVIFALDRGNMAGVRYSQKRIDEKTVACVWGQGEGAGRDYVSRTGANYGAANDIEMYVDAKDVDFGDTAGLNARGDQRLAENEALTEFEFTAVQAPSTLYGVHYYLGDTVSAVNPVTGARQTVKATSVSVAVDGDGREQVVPVFEAI